MICSQFLLEFEKTVWLFECVREIKMMLTTTSSGFRRHLQKTRQYWNLKWIDWNGRYSDGSEIRITVENDEKEGELGNGWWVRRTGIWKRSDSEDVMLQKPKGKDSLGFRRHGSDDVRYPKPSTSASNEGTHNSRTPGFWRLDSEGSRSQRGRIHQDSEGIGIQTTSGSERFCYKWRSS